MPPEPWEASLDAAILRGPPEPRRIERCALCHEAPALWTCEACDALVCEDCCSRRAGPGHDMIACDACRRAA